MDISNLDIGVETFRLVAATGLLILTAFSANILLLPDRDYRVRLPLALFFLASAIELLPLPTSYLLTGPQYQGLIFALELLEIPLSMALPFLLWLYVYRLTHDPTQPEAPLRWHRHLAPIVFACIVFLCIMLLPASLRDTIPLMNEPTTFWGRAAQVGILCANLLFYGLVPIYAVLILRRLRHYQRRLKDLFASTERRELAWAWWLSIAIIAVWLFSLVVLLAELFDLRFPGVEILQSLTFGVLLQYILFWSIALWGTRQRPGILPPPSIDDDEEAEKPEEVEEHPKPKYQHSGLSDVRLDRIATKIEDLMTKEHLYREPDLSLWELARRIGVTTHYASQALNQKIGACFFDYINRWRVREAASKLNESDATILTIAYDVGFNSRSSFYTAFKSEFGMTPSQYRASA